MASLNMLESKTLECGLEKLHRLLATKFYK